MTTIKKIISLLTLSLFSVMACSAWELKIARVRSKLDMVNITVVINGKTVANNISIIDAPFEKKDIEEGSTVIIKAQYQGCNSYLPTPDASKHFKHCKSRKTFTGEITIPHMDDNYHYNVQLKPGRKSSGNHYFYDANTTVVFTRNGKRK